MSKKLLLLDSETRSSLAVLRALGNFEFIIDTASSYSNPIASKSRFCNKHFLSPSPMNEPVCYQNWILDILEKKIYDIILPVTDASLNALSPISDKIREHCIYPVPSNEILEKIQDKYRLLDTAKEVGLYTPVSKLISGTENLEETLDDLKFPLMIRPRKSIFWENDILVSRPRKIVHDISQAISFIRSQSTGQFIAQELICGKGMGVFCLFKNGRSILDFSHSRILEKPPEGGISVLSESIPLDKNLLEKVHNLLSTFNFEGVAMVEFKLDKQGTPYLMEVNPRFWGSLQLAIDSGQNFPLALLESDNVSIDNNYKTGLRLRWILGSIDHTLLLVKKHGISFLLSIILENKLEFFRKKTSFEVAKLNDFKPFIYELKNYLTK